MRTFEANGYNDWLARIKKEKSVETTVKQLAEFVTWFKQAKYAILYYAYLCCAICVPSMQYTK
jgi:hypothetical protein